MLQLLAVFLVLHSTSAVDVVVHADKAVFVGSLSGAQVGHGVEDVNHELIGGVSTQMLFGEGFEEPRGAQVDVSGEAGGQARQTWAAFSPPAPPGAACSYAIAEGEGFTGKQSQGVSLTWSSTGAGGLVCGLENRGLDRQGLYVGIGESYLFSCFVRVLEVAPAGASVSLNVSLTDWRSGATLASTLIPLTAASEWTRIEAALTASAGTSCVLRDPSPRVACSPNAEDLCPSCSGALTVAVQLSSDGGSAGAATVLLDAAFLSASPGSARGPAEGAPASRADVVALIKRGSKGAYGVPSMGLDVLRLGGSAVSCVSDYVWKTFRGKVMEREPYEGFWYPWSSSGYGIFEFLELCEATAVHLCVVTLNSGESLEDIGDFIEYAYGDAGTVWGATRAADGHPAPFRPFAVEVGNEQDHTSPAFIAQVANFTSALKNAAVRLRLPFRLTVVVATVPGSWPPATILPMAAALEGVQDTLDLLFDFHVGGDSPQTDPTAAFRFIASVRDALAGAGSPILGAVSCAIDSSASHSPAFLPP